MATETAPTEEQGSWYQRGYDSATRDTAPLRESHKTLLEACGAAEIAIKGVGDSWEERGWEVAPFRTLQERLQQAIAQAEAAEKGEAS